MRLTAGLPDRRWLGRLEVTSPMPAVGLVALLAAVALVLTSPPTLLSVALGAVATAGLARDPRLGVLPAALLTMLVVPYGRAAETGLAELGTIPLRFHDGALAAAAILTIPALPRTWSVRRARPISRLVIAWLLVGLAAAIVGLIEGQAVRDILRDARWWFLYVAAGVAIWTEIGRRQVLRAVLIGASGFSAVVILAAVLPAFDAALKDRAMTYDWGLLRLQFSNSIFVIVAIAWVGRTFLLRPNRRLAAWLVLLVAVVFLSLTRMSIAAMLGVVVLTVAGVAAFDARRLGPARLGRRVGTLLAVLGLAAGVALAAFFVGDLTAARSTGGAPAAGGNDPVDRLLFQEPGSDVEAIGRGRFGTYRAAIDVISDAPLIGHGLGTLVPVEFTFGGAEPATPGMQPGVDNALLTVALKAGVIGSVVFAAMMLIPLLLASRTRDAAARWYLAGWLGALGLMMTQSFATSGYGPFGLALLAAVPALSARSRRAGGR